jgi:hypothetical protein
MISMARILGGAGEGARGKAGLEDVEGVASFLEPAAHVADQMHHVRVALHHHEFRHLDGADLGDAADVVAAEVHQHHVLRPLLRVALHLGGQPLVVRLVLAPGMGARDGPLLHPVVLEPTSTSGDEPTMLVLPRRRKKR